MPQELEGALLDKLNARAVLPKEVQVSLADEARDPAPALELGADHAILVDVRVA